MELYREVRENSVSIQKADKHTEVKPAFRLYCWMYAEAWNLQVRGPLMLGFAGVRKGKDNIIATVSLRRDEMIALRDAIDAQLNDR